MSVKWESVCHAVCLASPAVCSLIFSSSLLSEGEQCCPDGGCVIVKLFRKSHYLFAVNYLLHYTYYMYFAADISIIILHSSHAVCIHGRGNMIRRDEDNIAGEHVGKGNCESLI